MTFLPDSLINSAISSVSVVDGKLRSDVDRLIASSDLVTVSSEHTGKYLNGSLL